MYDKKHHLGLIPDLHRPLRNGLSFFCLVDCRMDDDQIAYFYFMGQATVGSNNSNTSQSKMDFVGRFQYK
jgi:hypothetical protein